MKEETKILKLMCWWIERSSSLAFTGFPVACLSFLLSFIFFHSDERMYGKQRLYGSKKETPLFPYYLRFFLLPASLAFSFSLFCCFFSAPFSSVFLFFLCSFFLPLVRSLEGFIYSLTYLYLEKIQCINSRMQIPDDV